MCLQQSKYQTIHRGEYWTKPKKATMKDVTDWIARPTFLIRKLTVFVPQCVSKFVSVPKPTIAVANQVRNLVMSSHELTKLVLTLSVSVIANCIIIKRWRIPRRAKVKTEITKSSRSQQNPARLWETSTNICTTSQGIWCNPAATVAWVCTSAYVTVEI